MMRSRTGMRSAVDRVVRSSSPPARTSEVQRPAAPHAIDAPGIAWRYRLVRVR